MSHMQYDECGHIKEVYAHFGVALYCAQILEHGLVNALVYLDLIPSRARNVRTREEWDREFDSFMDRHFETTLGRMVRNFSSVATVPPDLGGLLRDALSKRNWLAHDYFRDRAVEFMSRVGRDKMIAELKEAQTLFEQADECLDKLVAPLRGKYGLTEEKLAKAQRKLLASGAGNDS